MQLSPQQLAHVLAVWPVARFASVGEAQRPHQVPIVFAPVDGLIYSPIDGKPKRGGTLQRLRNVALGASVSLLLDHYDPDWQTLWWLRVDADADVVSSDADEFARVASALRAKYPQYEKIDLFDGVPTLLRIRPIRHVVWSAQSVDWEAL